jgi:capsular exopolysaccharide synthesis family protein
VGSSSETNLELRDTSGSLPLTEGAKLEQLRQELARLQAQFTDQYPDIVLLKKQIGELEAQNHVKKPSSVPLPLPVKSSNSLEKMREVQYKLIQDEHQAMLETIDIELLSLREKQIEISALINEHEKRIESAYENEQRLFKLSRDYDISLNNYQELLKKRLNAKLSENLEKRQKGEQFRVIDPAQLPESPVGPYRQGIIAVGCLMSMGLGIGLSMLIAYLTPSFQSPDDLRELFEYPVLATIPRVELSRKDDLLVALEEPDSLATEQYRILGTTLREAYAERGQKVFAISSAVENEGKSLTSLNLAIVMARDFGKRTLLLEGDLKRPSFSRYLHTEPKVGLVDILSDQVGIGSPLAPFHNTFISFAVDNLAVLPAAKSVGSSSALLSSQRMEDLLRMLREQYEYILIDTPPILPLSDMKIFAEIVDGILLVVRAESTHQGAVIEAVADVKIEKLTGFILNDVGRTSANYYRYSYYYKKYTA